MSINSFLSLYQPDARFGDGLIAHQRRCLCEWNELRQPLENDESVWTQIALKVAIFAVVILMALPSFILGLVGVAIKSCQRIPYSPREMLLRRNAEELIGPALPNNPLAIIPRQGPNLFQVVNVGSDIQKQIATFLNPRELLRLMQVSKNFNAVAGAPETWEQSVQSNRLWGISRSWKRLLEQDPERIRAACHVPAREQLKEYYNIRTGRSSILRGRFFDTLIRLNDGGPVAFRNMPRLHLESLEAIHNVKPEDMEAAVMRSDNLGRQVLFIRVIDRAIVGADPIVLALAEEVVPFGADPTPRIIQMSQIPNAYWGADNLLRVSSNDDHMDYVLGIIGLDVRPKGNDPRFKSQVELYNYAD